MSRRQKLTATSVFIASLAIGPQPARSQSEPAGEDDPQCRGQREAALISGEIVVCADRDGENEYRLQTDDAAASAYAAATMDKGLGRKPDFRPPPCRPSLLMLCPKFGSAPPPAIEVDFSRLPEAPPGSDAARLGREAPQP